MTYSIYIVSPPNYPHSAAFQEVAEGLKEGFAELGHVAPIVTDHKQIQGRPVVLGANLLPTAGVRIPDDAILFNLEQAHSNWMTDKYVHILQNHEVWDYSQQNINALKEFGVTAKLCPIGYEPCLTCIAPQEEDIDVLFYGSVFGRRAEILRSFETAGLSTKLLFGVYGIERDSWIARSKIILNLHAYEDSPLEVVRLSYLWANKRFVISEKFKDQEICRDVVLSTVYAPTEQLLVLCHRYIKDPESRYTVAQEGFRQFTTTRQSEYLKQVL